MLFGTPLRMDIRTFHRLFDVTDNLSRISGNDSVKWDIFSDDATRANNRVFAYVGVGKNRGPGADGRTLPYNRAFDLPVSLSLQISFGSRSTRIAVLNKRHSVLDQA